MSPASEAILGRGGIALRPDRDAAAPHAAARPTPTAHAPRQHAHHPLSSRARRVLLGALGLVLFIALWKLAHDTRLGRHGAIPDPFAIPRAFLQEWDSGRLASAVDSSLIHYVWGLAMGTALGLALGIATALSRPMDELLAGVVRVLRPIPPLAWVIFAIAWFKISQGGAAFVVSIGVFWINCFAAYSAVRGIDPKYNELARAFEQNGVFKRLRDITLPGAAPGIFAGVHTGIGAALMALIAAELIGMPGIGQEMNVAAGVGDYTTVAVYMLVISLIYAVFDTLFLGAEKWGMQWRPS